MSKPLSPELLALLATRQYYVADVYSFALLDGGTLRYCAGDADITYNGQLYTAGGQTGPYFDRQDNKAKSHWKIGLEVDTLTFDVIPGSALVQGANFLSALRTGVFDGAELLLERLYMPTYGDTRRGAVRMFLGRVAEVDFGRSVATFTINSHVELLNQQMPRNIYCAGCINNLGDSNCGVNVSSFSTTGTVSSGTTNALVEASLVGSFGAGTFDLGTITFTSGTLNGLTFSVQQCTFGSPNLIQLVGYTPIAASASDTFTLYYGCDKSPGVPLVFLGDTTINTPTLMNITNPFGVVVGMSVSGTGVPANTTVARIIGTTVVMSANATSSNTQTSLTFQSANGCGKFSNQARFRGFPFIPQPNTAA